MFINKKNIIIYYDGIGYLPNQVFELLQCFNPQGEYDDINYLLKLSNVKHISK